MGDFRTVIFYKSEDAMDGVDFDNPHQYDTDEGYFIGLAHDVVRWAVRTYEQRTTIRYQVSEISAFYPDCW